MTSEKWPLLFLHKYIGCEYSLERGTSSEYQQLMFLWRNDKRSQDTPLAAEWRSG